jgi:hypothetical protein
MTMRWLQTPGYMCSACSCVADPLDARQHARVSQRVAATGHILVRRIIDAVMDVQVGDKRPAAVKTAATPQKKANMAGQPPAATPGSPGERLLLWNAGQLPDHWTLLYQCSLQHRWCSAK